MLAPHRDENRVFAHQSGAVVKQQNLQPKTPGARYPKTPLKVPLNDENAAHVLGGKSVLGGRPTGNENLRTVGKGGKGGEKSLVTPLEPRTARAPLGNKTTNAKARTGQATTVKSIARDFEKNSAQAPTNRRPKALTPKVDSAKLQILNDEDGSGEDEIEYCPPKPKEEPYESDVLPEGSIPFEAFKPENRLKGYYDYYYNPVGADGVPLQEKKLRDQQQAVFKRADEAILKDMDDFEWSIGDTPASKGLFKKQSIKLGERSGPPLAKPSASRLTTKGPSTIASRKAAAALSMGTKPTTALQPKAAKPLNTKKASLLPFVSKASQPQKGSVKTITNPSTTTRSTLGYNKGRSTSSVLSAPPAAEPAPKRTFSRTVSTASSGSDKTITPARYARQAQQTTDDAAATKKLELLSIFDTNNDSDDGLGVDENVINEDLDETFQFNLPA